MIDHAESTAALAVLGGQYLGQAALAGTRLYAAAVPSEIAAFDIAFDGTTLTATPSTFAQVDPSHTVIELDVLGSFAAWTTTVPGSLLTWCSAPNCARPESIPLQNPRELALGTGRAFFVGTGETIADRRVRVVGLADGMVHDAFDTFNTGVQGLALVGTTVVFTRKAAMNNLVLARCCGNGPLDDLGGVDDCQEDVLADTSTDDVIEMFEGPGNGVTLWLRSPATNDRVMYVAWDD
jgi:hypothetical protein